MEKQSIYPNTARQNCNCWMYAEIAVKNYYEAKKSYQTIRNNNYAASDCHLESQMDENIIITCVFAAMSIESFLNNYAATCLGDKEYYDIFDNLSVIRKLMFISKFILSKDIDKGNSYLSNLRLLIKHRDSFVHNKSKQLNLEQYISKANVVDEFVEPDAITLDPKEIKQDLAMAQTAIKAMRDCARFFDDSDANSHALDIYFQKCMPETFREPYYNDVIKEFSI